MLNIYKRVLKSYKCHIKYLLFIIYNYNKFIAIFLINGLAIEEFNIINRGDKFILNNNSKDIFL